tara:strand:+ start:4396 stop:12870 length:8475 start_codon:yes stop_codon:yes gene_type:complete
MSLKALFEDISLTKVVADKTAAEIGDVVESYEYHKADIIDEKRFVPEVDFSKPENFAKYGSAEKYYEDSFTYIHSLYPYDGSLSEKLQWRNSGSYIDLYIFDNEYPRTTGYINFSTDGWGSIVGSLEDGYGLSDALEYIGVKGGPGIGGGVQNQSSNVWDPNNNRESNLEIDLTEGVTVEFWLNKEAFNNSNTEKEVIVDIWNNEQSSSADYGRLRLELTGAASTPSWLVTILSGTTGVQWQAIGSATSTTVADGNWHHYAFSFLSASTGITTKSYLDGALQTTETIGSAGINKIPGSMQANIGALLTSVSGTAAPSDTTIGYGKLSGSLDEFRYWKTQRTSEKIGRYWFTQIGGGTNTDLANTDLGVYYKFNEGITGVTATDSTVLDYSGRVTNGTWTGYSTGARNVGSAIVSSSAAATEFADPIIYSFHPDVEAKLNSLKLSGSTHDFENSSQLFTFFPSWMQENDFEQGGELKKLTQVMSSYFDNLYLQIESFSDLQDIQYLSGSSTKENVLANRLLAGKGFVAPELFADADILEQLGDRDEKRQYRDSLSNIKNKIYQNIYNNLINIYKTKGTRQSFRNLIRCFGVDEKIYRLNVYGNNVEFEIRNNRELSSIKKKYIDFSQTSNFGSTVFLTSSTDSNTVSYLSGASELTGGFASTLETYVLFPKKPAASEKAYSNYYYNNLTASLFGRHTADPSNPNSLTWPTPDNANYQVYAIRDEIMSGDVKFVLTTSAGGVLPTISSSYYQEVYDNTNWVFAVTIKPTGYPLVDSIEGTSTTDYVVEFKGTQVDAGVVLNSFTVTGSFDATNDGYGPITGSTRIYLGSHRTNFTGSTLESTDIRAGYCRYWLDDIEMPILQAHAKDISNYGTARPSEDPFLFQNNQALNLDFKRGNTLALNWDFETVTGSNASGQFVVTDFSSGSTETQSTQFGFLGNLLGAQHAGQGFGFPVSDTNVIDADYNIAAELLEPEKLTSEDMIEILSVQDDIQFTRESRPINYLFAIEKSMYATISEEMIKTFAVITDFNNIIGNPVNKYRSEYKDLRVLRQMFFDRVGNTPDLDKYIEYYKWFDSALSKMLQQLIPASAEFSDNVENIVESHILERSKYQHKFPTLEFKKADLAGTIESPLPLSPGWEFTHAPPPASGAEPNQENVNANWWLTRAARNSGQLASGDAAVDGNRERIFKSSIRDNKQRKEKNIFRFSNDEQKLIDGGTNFANNKIKNFVFEATAPWGPLIPTSNIPKNIMLSFDTDVQEEQDISDDLTPGKKKRIRYAINPSINKSDENNKAKGSYLTPFSLYSSSATTDYSTVISASFKPNIIVTNLHEDIVGDNDTRPLQGPFTEKFVGGRYYRHTELNDGTDTRENRAEGFRLTLGLDTGSAGIPAGAVGALGIVPPNYPFVDSPSGSAPNGFLPALKTAHRLRPEGTKRSVNIKNILMTTDSVDVRLSGTIVHNSIGNYTKNYQVVQTSGRTNNDLFYRNQSFSFAPYPETLATRGRFPLATTSTENVGGNLDYALPNRDGSNSNKTVFVNRFSAPGSTAASSRGYLDPAHEEKSAYNAIPYRNLGVLNYGLSGSASVDPTISTTIRVQDQIDKPRGLRQRLTLHCGQFGVDAAYGTYPTVGYPTIGSYHKINRNRRRRLETYAASTVTASVYDNGFVTHPIPRSDQQYQWITSSLSSNSIIYGYTELSGGYFVQSLPTISRSVDYEDGDFNYLRLTIIDPVNSSTNTLGFPLDTATSSYVNADYWVSPAFDNTADMFNTMMLNRNGPYQYPTWKQVRVRSHPVVRAHRNENVYSVVTKNTYDASVGASRGNTLKRFTEPVVYSSEMPLRHTLNAGDVRLTFKNSFGNKLIHFANYEIDNIENTKKDYESSDLYFNRINSMILKSRNNDDRVSSLLTSVSVVYSQRVYPASYNSYLNRTRTRESYTISDVWDKNRTNRVKAVSFTTSQDFTIAADAYVGETSIWPLDAHNNYSTTSSIQIAINSSQNVPDGAGELQNQYSRYFISSSVYGPTSGVFPAATYASRVPLGSTASIPVFGGDQFWDAPGQSGKQPYQTYEQYQRNLRLIGKDYSLVPEFRISKHIDEYLQTDDFTTLTSIDDLLELSGTAYTNSSEDGFFKEYANSDFMKFFEIVDKEYEGTELVDNSIMSKDSIGLKCSALLKFLPYKGFYPAERTLELASIFKESYKDQIRTGNETVDYRAILEPLFSPGIMFNTIKSGLAVSNFVLQNTASNATVLAAVNTVENVFNEYTASVTVLPEGSLRFEGGLTFSSSHMNGTDTRDNGYFPQKIPFEAIYQPATFLTETYLSGAGNYIYDSGVGSSSLQVAYGNYDHHAAWSGEGKENYQLAVDNFLCETIDFFGQGLTNIVSDREENFGTVTSGSEYRMTLKLYRPYDYSTGRPDYDSFDIYRRQSAFGTPLFTNVDGSSYSASYSHLTPSYYDGSGSATFIYTAQNTGQPTLEEILANTTIEFDRDEFSPLQLNKSLGTEYSSSVRMEVEDSFKLTEIINSTPNGTTDLKKQWLIQSKFETPILNFVNATASVTPPTTDVAVGLSRANNLSGSGMWHTYGDIPSGTNGAFAVVEDNLRSSYGSLANVVGMPTGRPHRLGRVKTNAVLEEAVVAVPFFVGEDGRRKFYKLDSKAIPSIKKTKSHLKKYVFPPRFDYVINPEMDKVAMYVFEFGIRIKQQDISDIWQNLPPDIGETFEKRVSTIEHKLLSRQILNKSDRPVRKDLRWLVFKVKKRAQKDFTRYTKIGLVDDLSVIPSNINNRDYSYNWPYDYFSLVELIKIDESIEYKAQMPPDSTVEVIGNVNITAASPIPVILEGD